MFDLIQSALHNIDASDKVWPAPFLVGAGGYNANFPVSALANAAVCAAVSAMQKLYVSEFGQTPNAVVNAGAVDQWCKSSITPLEWPLPSKWDVFSKDYPTRDGWIRLHTNAPHHRAAALNILGEPQTPDDVEFETLKWSAEALETEIVGAGGCAAKLRTVNEWHRHPQGIVIDQEPIIGWSHAHKAPCRWSPMSNKRPLTGLRVLDLTRVLAGPVATRFLASLGADVLRIDPPDWNEDGNAIEMTIGKTCAGLDLKVSHDRDKFIELLASADVIVHGYRADALARLGFSDQRCRSINPGLTSVALNAYGWEGPWRNRRGFDSLVQRSTGLAIEKNGRIEGLPYQVLDHATGYLMAAAVLHALRYQRMHHFVLSARLSLARQAKLLIDNAGWIQTPSSSQEPLALYDNRIEQTDWGPIQRLALPYEIDFVDAGWDVCAHKLRTDPPNWRKETEVPL